MEIDISILALAMRILIFAFLYTFIFWVLKAKDLLLPKIVPEKIGETQKIAISISLSSGNSQLFFGPQITIGRHPACEYILDEEAISLRHARISYKDGNWWLKDLNSKNGTYLNSEQIFDGQLLAVNDEIKIGHVRLFISWD